MLEYIEQEDGVLTPTSLAELAKVHQAVANLKTETSGLMWNDVCLQVQLRQKDYVCSYDPQVGMQCQQECPELPTDCPLRSPPWIGCYPEPWCEYIQV